MKQTFYSTLLQQHQSMEAVPSNQAIGGFVDDLIGLLFPEKKDKDIQGLEDVEKGFLDLEAGLIRLFESTRACKQCDNAEKASKFFDAVPELYRLLNTDIEALLSGDPAARSRFEIIRAYPGFLAVAFYRIAHTLYQLDIPFLPRIITEIAHSRTGIDIHPAAQVGEYFFIDHGTGTVIGETTRIGNHVKLYQGVTLGALSVEKEMADTKRHPTVEDHVIIYSGATILGGQTVIGHHSVIGGNVWLTKTVPPRSTVYHRAQTDVVEQPKSL